MRKSNLLELLVDAKRLNKALNTEGDFKILVEHASIIRNLAKYEEWIKDIYDSREIKEFKKVVKYLENEKSFLEKKKSTKAVVIASYIKSINNAYYKLLTTFKFLLDEIYAKDENVARNGLIRENMILRNLLAAKGIHFDVLDVNEDTSIFLKVHRGKYNKIDKKIIQDTDRWLIEYKKKHGKVPETVTQLKDFLEEEKK